MECVYPFFTLSKVQTRQVHGPLTFLLDCRVGAAAGAAGARGRLALAAEEVLLRATLDFDAFLTGFAFAFSAALGFTRIEL